MFKRCFVIILFAIPLLAVKSYAQDPEFSQFYANPLYLNPALAGVTLSPRANANFRDQWPGIKAFITYGASYDQYVNFLHGGVGMLVTADLAGSGTLNAAAFSLMYAYKFNLSERFQVSAAVKVGYYQRWIQDWDKFIFQDMIDRRTGTTLPPSIQTPPAQNSKGVPDFSTGIFLGYGDIVYGGIAVDHLTQPDVSFYDNNPTPLNIKYTIHAGSVISLNQNDRSSDDREFSISPNILYQQQDNYHQLNVGVYCTIDPIVAGVWFRHNFENADAIIPLVGLHYKNLRIGYSYDLTISKLSSVSGGSHEISASWQFSAIEKRRHIRAIKCPRF